MNSVSVPGATTILRSGLGGILMGIGATLAGGCSIGNGLVETAFSLARLGIIAIDDSRHWVTRPLHHYSSTTFKNHKEFI